LAALLAAFSGAARGPDPGNLIVLLGGGISICCGLLDALRYRHAADINLMQTGLLILDLCGHAGHHAAHARNGARAGGGLSARRPYLERNRELRQLDNIRTSFLADISHEMRTPLTVMSSYAGLTKMQIMGGKVSGDTLENLDIIQHEAVRLGTMTEQIKLSSVKREQQIQETDCDINQMLVEVSRFCAPICVKNENRIELESSALSLCASALSRTPYFRFFITSSPTPTATAAAPPSPSRTPPPADLPRCA
jgi:signal transduction histidine kinase